MSTNLNILPGDPSPDPEGPQPDLSAKGIWQQLPNETPHAYACFTTYLQLGPDATLQEAADRLRKNFGAVSMLSSRHCWIERAAAWRQHLAATACAAVASQVREKSALLAARESVLREQRWELAQSMREAAAALLFKFLKDAEAKPRLYEITHLIQAMSKVGDAAVKEETPEDVAAQAAAALSDERFNQALRAVHAKRLEANQVKELKA